MEKKRIVEKILLIVLFLVEILLIYCKIEVNKDSTQETLSEFQENINEAKEINSEEKYKYVNLRINMPLNLNDLEEYFENPIQNDMDKNGIGEIIGDGMPLDDDGFPYAVDIEFEVEKNKLEEFKDILKNYKFPSGTYLEDEEEIIEEYGELHLAELRVEQLSEKRAKKVYEELKEEMKEYCTYVSIYNYNVNNKIERIYFCGENLEKMQEIIEEYIEKNDIEI